MANGSKGADPYGVHDWCILILGAEGTSARKLPGSVPGTLPIFRGMSLHKEKEGTLLQFQTQVIPMCPKELATAVQAPQR